MSVLQTDFITQMQISVLPLGLMGPRVSQHYCTLIIVNFIPIEHPVGSYGVDTFLSGEMELSLYVGTPPQAARSSRKMPKDKLSLSQNTGGWLLAFLAPREAVINRK